MLFNALFTARYYVTCLHGSVCFLDSYKTYNSSKAFFCEAAWSSTLIQDCQCWAWTLSDTVSEAHPPTATTVGMVHTVLHDSAQQEESGGDQT